MPFTLRAASIVLLSTLGSACFAQDGTSFEDVVPPPDPPPTYPEVVTAPPPVNLFPDPSMPEPRPETRLQVTPDISLGGSVSDTGVTGNIRIPCPDNLCLGQ